MTANRRSKEDRKPKDNSLSGIRVLVGRSRKQASTLSSALRELGAFVLEIPFIEVRKPRSYKPLDAALSRIQAYDWLIMTSVNGVEAVFDRLRKLSIEAESLNHIKIAAIGPATKKSIEDRGVKVDIIPERYVAESVVDSLRNHVAGKKILLARARVARDVIPLELRKLGAEVDVVEAYETIMPQSSRTALRAAIKDPVRRPHVVTFTSSSTVKNFMELLGKRDLDQLHNPGIKYASIGPITSATMREVGLPVHVEAEEFTIPGLVQAIHKLASAR